MTTTPRQPEPDRRATEGRRTGLDRRIGERRSGAQGAVVVNADARRGFERRQAPERRQSAGRRKPELASGRPSVVLFVGEDPRDAQLLHSLLETSSGRGRFLLETVDRPRAAVERLNRGDVDVALVDESLPHGLETFAELSTMGPTAPFLVLSRSDDEDLAVEAARAGAQDYLVRGRFDGQLLTHALRYAIERHRLRTALRDLLLLDQLTGLYNRRGFVTLATHDLRIARRSKQPLLVAFADLDDLKVINDTLGHAQGDAALRDVAAILRRTFRESDLIARIGGDEYAILVRSAEAGNVEVLRERLDEELRAFAQRARRPYRISVSLGFAHTTAATTASVDGLLRRADRALYQEKRRRDSGPRRLDRQALPGPIRPYEARPIEILLVEDDPTDIELTEIALRRGKLLNRLSIVRDGAEAMAFLRARPPFEAVAPPDVVLLDLKLPKKDGADILSEMRADAELRDIPVVILTATNAEHVQFDHLHPDGFLTKPVDFERLVQAIRSVANLGFTIVKLSA